jgi:uncharacterized protein YodC (DUF2158 family)
MAIKVGDTVKLKSGGPVMTASTDAYKPYGAQTAKSMVSCQWFVGEDVKSADFPEDSLEHAEPKKKGIVT